MSEYLDEVLEAVEHAMDGVWARALVAERLYAHADSIRDDNYWTSYYTWRDANKIQDKVDAASFARSALAQAVLQCGKQGLSIVHGPRRNSPEGRMVYSSVCLRDLIWEGRNQAQHWEEGRLSAGVSTQFTSLASEVNQVFSEFNRRSMSVETLEVLGWRSVDSFAADMLSLA